MVLCCVLFFFFFKQKTAYEMRISDWSLDVCSSDLDFHGLKYLAQKFLGAPDWDVDGKEKTAWSPKNAKYAAHDVYYTRKLRFILKKQQIGRASCRERVCQYV